MSSACISSHLLSHRQVSVPSWTWYSPTSEADFRPSSLGCSHQAITTKTKHCTGHAVMVPQHIGFWHCCCCWCRASQARTVRTCITAMSLWVHESQLGAASRHGASSLSLDSSLVTQLSNATDEQHYGGYGCADASVANSTRAPHVTDSVAWLEQAIGNLSAAVTLHLDSCEQGRVDLFSALHVQLIVEQWKLRIHTQWKLGALRAPQEVHCLPIQRYADWHPGHFILPFCGWAFCIILYLCSTMYAVIRNEIYLDLL